jgi:hypothetical protein
MIRSRAIIVCSYMGPASSCANDVSSSYPWKILVVPDPQTFGVDMKPTEKAKVTILVTHPISLEQLKKYASPKPLRRPAPRPKS